MSTPEAPIRAIVARLPASDREALVTWMTDLWVSGVAAGRMAGVASASRTGAPIPLPAPPAGWAWHPVRRNGK
jgi:hypothetical protein